MKRKSIQERVDAEWKRELDITAINRIKNDLEVEKLPIKEITRMMLNTSSWKNVRDELETKPRRKDE